MKKKSHQSHNIKDTKLKLVSDIEHLTSSKENFFADMLKKIIIFRILWYLLVLFFAAIGVGAAFVSFLFEKEVFYQIIQQQDFYFWIVLIFESARILPIMMYGKKTLNIAWETHVQAVQEILNDYLVKRKICIQRERTEFLLEQKLGLEKALMKSGNDFNENIIKSYEKADKIKVPELKKKYIEFINNSIGSYHALALQLQGEFQEILNEGRLRYKGFIQLFKPTNKE